MATLATNYDISTLELAVRAAGVSYGTTINPSDIRLALRAFGIESGEAINDSDVRLLLRKYVETLPNIKSHEVNPVADNILNGVTTIESTTTKFGGTVPEPKPKPNPNPPPAPNPPPSPSPPPPPSPDPVPEPEPIDYRARVQALYPWLPDPLVGVFADQWAETGDPQTALAEMRTSPLYDQFYGGNRREDGTLRHTEAEYASIKDAFRVLYREFNLNPTLFEDKFTELIEKDQSPMEHAERLGAAKEQIIDNIPQVREIYARYGNIAMTDEAIFASVINPDIGDAIINRRISVAQVAGEALARSFDITQDFAGRLVSGGVGQEAARTLFATAEGELADLNELVRRHRDPDDTFDLEEFADANVFGNAEQNERIQRALRAEAASFSERIGTVATGDDFRISGLTAR